MFKIENFESIYNLIEKNDKVLSQKELDLSRTRYALHPDYLFLMSKYLILDKILMPIGTTSFLIFTFAL